MTNQPKFGQWIKCSERLPEVGQHVLFLERTNFSHDMIVACCMKTERGGFYFELVTDDNVVGYEYDIEPIYIGEKSHWMILPEAPNE